MKAFAFALAAAAPALAILEREKHLLSPPSPPLGSGVEEPLVRRQLNGTEPLESSIAVTRTATETVTGTPRATGSSRTGTATAPGPSATGSGDACSLFSASIAGTLFTNEEIRACFDLIPLDEQLKANTLEVVEKMYEQSIFELNQRDTPAPLTQQVDVRAELARIASQSYATDYAFSRDLSRVVDSLNDGHYYHSDCFGTAFVSFMPFPPVSFVSNPTSTDAGKVYVANDAESILDQYDEYFYIKDYYNDLGLDASFLAGKEITAIDGKAPWDRIDEIANESGTYQSLQARRTNALAGRSLVGVESARTLGSVAQQTWPDRDNITYTIGGQDYVIPYVARRVSQYKYTSASTFKTNNCLAAGASSAGSFAVKNPLTAAERNPLALFPEEVGLVEGRGWRGQIQEKRQTSSSSCKPSRGPYVVTPNDPRKSATFIGGTDIQFYILPASDSNTKPVGVIWLATFSPDTGCTERYLSETNAGFRNFTRAGVEKIIIDTTGNGGGSIALSMVWQSFFSPNNLIGDINFSGVMRDTPLARKCLNAHLTGAGDTRSSAAYYGPGNFRSVDGSALTTRTSNYFGNGRNITINGAGLPVSDVLRDTLPRTYLATTTYNPANVVIFGDGLCGSACATFTSFLVRYLNVQTVVVHPRPGEKTEFQQFEAGQALTSKGIYTELDIDGLENDPEAPPPMIADATIGFAWRGHLVPGTIDQFIQYSSSPAGSTVGMTQEFYDDPVAMWTYIASSGPLSASPKLATTGQGVGGGAAASAGGSSTSGGGSSSSNPGSDALGRVQAVKGSLFIGVAAAIALAAGL